MKFAFLTFTVSYLLLSVPTRGSGGKHNFEHELREFEKQIANHFNIKHYKLMEIEKLKKILDDLKISSPFQKQFLADRTLCGVCKLLISQIQQRGLTVKIIGEAFCNIYITLSTWTVSNFCEEVIKLNLPILEYIVENSKILDPELACSVLLQNDMCYYKKPALIWRSQIPSKSQMKVPQVTNNPNAKPLKILHLTDFHISPNYDVGGVVNCGYPVCCKKGLGNPLLGGQAGTWGDYNCDIPLWLFGNTMFHINQTHKDIDLVYFTGDIIDHTVWKSSVEENSKLIYFTYKTLFETFPNTPILPVVGNHESTPLNVYAPSHQGIEVAGLSTQWLYTLLSKLWSPWLSSESLNTVQKQGYYSHLVNSKFKIIALNNNICYNFNWWVLYNTTYFSEQLEFLSRELEEAEKNDQFVHIITHIPVGIKECIEPWEVNYSALVRRFAHIIKGQFYGHTHTDELKIFYNENHTPINVGYNGGSLTPYVKYNPNYKIVTVDPNSYNVSDIDTYYFNLTDANLHPERTPNWIKLYSMKQAYDLDELSPRNFDRLALEMFKNDALFNLYWRFYVKNGDASLSDGCDNKCRMKTICEIFTTESFSPEVKQCK